MFFNILLQACIILGSIAMVLMLISGGWYLVWKFFLSRFRLVRELFMLNEVQQQRPPRATRPRAVRAD